MVENFQFRGCESFQQVEAPARRPSRAPDHPAMTTNNEKTKRALKDLSAVRPYDPGSPCEIEIAFTSPDRLVEYRNRRGVEQVDALTLASKAGDWWTAWSQFYF